MRIVSMFVALALCSLLAVNAHGAGKVGDMAPGLQITKSHNTDDGGPLSLGDFRGRVVLIDFWATWCGPCVQAIPHMQKLHETYGDKGLVILGHTDSSSSSLENFIASKGMTYPVTIGKKKVYDPDYGINGIPRVVAVDPEGKILWIGHPASLDDGQVKKWVELIDPFLAAGGLPKINASDLKDEKVKGIVGGIRKGAVGKGWKLLDKIVEKGDKGGDAAADASKVIADITSWVTEAQTRVDAKLEAGDVYAGWELAERMATLLKGHDAEDPFKENAKNAKRDKAWRYGETYYNLLNAPAEAKKDKRFQSAVEKITKNDKAGIYQTLAEDLLQ